MGCEECYYQVPFESPPKQRGEKTNHLDGEKVSGFQGLSTNERNQNLNSERIPSFSRVIKTDIGLG